jgi:hypothetical protein
MAAMPEQIKEYVREYGRELETLGKQLAGFGAGLQADPSDSQHHLWQLAKVEVDAFVWVETGFDSLRAFLDGSWCDPPDPRG